MEFNFNKYNFFNINNIEDVKVELADMYYMVTSCNCDLYKLIGNKIITFDDFVEYTEKYIKDDYTEGMYFFNLCQCAKDYYNLTTLKEILKECLKEIQVSFEGWGTEIITTVKDAFKLLTIENDKLLLPTKWFSPLLYTNIKKFITAFECDCITYKKQKAFKVIGKFAPAQIIRAGEALGGVDLSTKFDFFPTPEILVQQVQKLAEIKDTDTILEPSAGTGNLLQGLNKDNIQCIEINNILAEILKQQDYKVIQSNFEDVENLPQYDKIIMNPPFSKRLDAKHIALAFNKYLKTGGILVAIHSNGITTATDKQSKQFQELYQLYGVYQKPFTDKEFKDMGKGTTVDTCISKFVKI